MKNGTFKVQNALHFIRMLETAYSTRDANVCAQPDFYYRKKKPQQVAHAHLILLHVYGACIWVLIMAFTALH